MFYIIYKITNKVNGKIYIGSHKTKNINDGYMGSGKYLNYAIKKHGIENFFKEILFVFNNPTDMYNKESEIVNDDFLAEENTYNLKRGGFGGFDFINAKKLNVKNGFAKGTAKKFSEKGVAKRKLLIEKNPNWQAERNKVTSAALKGRPSPFKGKTHSLESKIKMKESCVDRSGEKNSQFGTCWIYHELVGNRKCKKDLLPFYIDQGWLKGRFSI